MVVDLWFVNQDVQEGPKDHIMATIVFGAKTCNVDVG